MTASLPTKGKPRGPSPRSAARMAAVQALYQRELTDGGDPKKLIEEYLAHRIGKDIDGLHFAKADEALFADLVQGVITNLGEIDSLIAGVLSENWDLTRLEAILRAILRCGTYELGFRSDIPPKVAINEYMAVTDAFFGEKETGMANGVLDTLAKELRSAEP